MKECELKTNPEPPSPRFAKPPRIVAVRVPVCFFEFLLGKYYIFVYKMPPMDTTSSFSEQLFEELFRRYKRKYLLIANSYVRDSKTAEDIVHDSFMAVWEHRDDIRGTNIEAYLYKVVRNNCLMYRRNRQIGQAVYERILLKERRAMDYYTRAIESCDPDMLFRDEILEICRTQLERMPELTQRIFKARRLEGKSYREIAEQFGIPQKKVDKQLQQAVAKLRRALKDFFSIVLLLP